MNIEYWLINWFIIEGILSRILKTKIRYKVENSTQSCPCQSYTLSLFKEILKKAKSFRMWMWIWQKTCHLPFGDFCFLAFLDKLDHFKRFLQICEKWVLLQSKYVMQCGVSQIRGILYNLRILLAEISKDFYKKEPFQSSV